MTGETAPVPAAGAVVLDEGRLLLVERGKGPLQGTWAVPGGRQLLGESLRQTARRETFEETGIEIEVGEPCWVGDVIDPSDPPSWHFSIVDFRADLVGGSLRPGGDARQAAWVSLAEADRLATTPTMRSLLDALEAG